MKQGGECWGSSTGAFGCTESNRAALIFCFTTNMIYRNGLTAPEVDLLRNGAKVRQPRL